MRQWIFFASLALCGAAPLTAAPAVPPPTASPPARALFVGNSLTYFNNLPAVFAALATANGHPVASDLLVAPGAELRERVADGTAARALAARHYDLVVLQERGMVCAFGAEACEAFPKAVRALAELAARHGARAVVLGTYQALPQVSKALVADESAAARAAGVPYVEVSDTLRRVEAALPDLAWRAPDGGHPGKDLTLLDAVRLYQTLYGAAPAARAVSMDAPVYGNPSGLDPTVRAADAPPPLPATSRGLVFDAATVERLLDALDQPTP